MVWMNLIGWTATLVAIASIAHHPPAWFSLPRPVWLNGRLTATGMVLLLTWALGLLLITARHGG